MGFHVDKRVPKIIFETCSRDFVKVTSETGNALIRRLTFIPGTSHPIEDGPYIRDISCFRGNIRIRDDPCYRGRPVSGPTRARWDNPSQGRLVLGRLAPGTTRAGTTRAGTTSSGTARAWTDMDHCCFSCSAISSPGVIPHLTQEWDRMRSSIVRMRSSLLRMRSSLVVRTSDCQCTSCNGPGFDPSIRRHSGIWGAADEAVLNIVQRKK